MKRRALFAVAALSLLVPQAAADIVAADVERLAPDRIFVTWRSAGPVDVLIAVGRDGTLETASLTSDGDTDGRHELAVDPSKRPYLILRDEVDGQVVRVAERLLPLAQGSNFRDLGGYPAVDGRRVKWGRIFRSGATPLLTEADVAFVARELGVTKAIDLRSTEERQLAPTRLAGSGVTVIANDYAADLIFRPAMQPPAPASAGGATPIRSLYRDFPTLLAPQYRALFQQLLAGDGAVEVNCSAGQDRTGVASALVLTVLGVPRGIIYRDYLMSTAVRRPEHELPPFDPKDFPDNPVAQFYARLRSQPGAMEPRPLYGADGRIYLADAFDEIETKWGSVEAYVTQELGVGEAERERLRALYLE